MRSQPPTAALAAPASGAATEQAAQRARLLALLARHDVALAPAAPGRHQLAPPPAGPLSDPATDPARWLGFC